MMSSGQPPKLAISTVFYAVLVVLSMLGGTSCTGPSDQEFDLSGLVLHVEYRSGGDAPLGFLMSFFDDGRIRFLSPRRKVLWSRLTEVENHHLQALRRSPEFQRSIEFQVDEGPTFGCCDAHEVGIFLGPKARPATIWFNSSKSAPTPLYDVLRFINKIGDAHFGRRFSLRLPLEKLERSSEVRGTGSWGRLRGEERLRRVEG